MTISRFEFNALSLREKIALSIMEGHKRSTAVEIGDDGKILAMVQIPDVCPKPGSFQVTGGETLERLLTRPLPLFAEMPKCGLF